MPAAVDAREQQVHVLRPSGCSSMMRLKAPSHLSRLATRVTQLAGELAAVALVRREHVDAGLGLGLGQGGGTPT